MKTKFKYLTIVSYVLLVGFGISYAKTVWVPAEDVKKTPEVKANKTSENKTAEKVAVNKAENKKDVKVRISGVVSPDNNFIKTSIPSPSNTDNSSIVVLEGEGLNQQQQSDPVYHVNSGDTIYSISKRHGITPETLMKMNNIGSPKELKVGQILKLPIPTSTQETEERTSVATTAEIDDTPSVSEGDTPGKKLLGEATPSKYRIQKNDTLFSLAKKYNTTVDAILLLNKNLQVNALKVNDEINIPSQTASASNMKIVDSTKDTNQAESSNKPKVAADDGVESKKLVTNIETLDLKAINFSWPVKGRIIGKYGVSEEGTKNDGIDIFAPKGTPIKAVESGKVIYIGDNLGNFGNLILIQHPNKWVSAYAYTDNIMVKKGQEVSRGDVIARVGINTKSASSELHFQLRKNKKPVNPADYLVGFNMDNSKEDSSEDK